MGSENRSITRYDTTAVYTHTDARVDIVLVHGLSGSPDKTWTAKNGTFWPRDLLPTALKDEKASIIVYGYNADVNSKTTARNVSDTFVHQQAEKLAESVINHRQREGTCKNPIIWVCHGLGGSIVKQALVHSNAIHEPHLQYQRSIFVSTYGIVFLGTPHTEDASTWGQVLQAMSDAIAPKRLFGGEPMLLKTLKKDPEALTRIDNRFCNIYRNFEILMVHENQPSEIKGSKFFVVGAEVAHPPLPHTTSFGIEAAHLSMCKFDSLKAPGFIRIRTAIQKWVRDAPAQVQKHWMRENESPASAAGDEVMPPFTPSQTSGEHHLLAPTDNMTRSPPLLQLRNEPTFVHPERFRPNSFFKGRKQELTDLHEMLMDKERREDGTSAVLIWSIPGGGKTHLAREYAFKHKHDYPGGIFWVRAKSPEDIMDAFVRIAKHAMARNEIEIQDETSLQDHSKVIPLVRDWLNRSDNWLLILDGVLHDTPDLADCIPDTVNTSMILTSTDTSIAGNHNFDNPQKLELGPLGEEEAQMLLLEETDRKKTWTPDDLDRALEIAKLTECLPLAIHAAAGQMRATREPMSKYIRSYKKRPQAGGLGAYKAVREKLEERGETEALNLMYLLSFFSGSIPVEMLALGLEALDGRTPVLANNSVGKPSLNKTFTVLIAFALIERDEVEDMPSLGSTQPAEPLDVLKTHTIVQSFFLEALKGDGLFEFWLERAAAVFLKSFDKGDRRARDMTEMGLPGDYRTYASHCRKILKHIRGVDEPTRELLVAEKALQSRSEDIQGQISALARTMTTESFGKWGQDPHVSVFERTNSASPSRWVEATDGGRLPDERQSSWDLQASLPAREHNPHFDHIPYPYDSTILTPHFFKDESHHTVQRQPAGGYFDPAGSWPETTEHVSEPRVSISKVALGRFSPRGSTLDLSPPGTSPILSLGAEEQFYLAQHAITQSSPKVSENNGQTAHTANVSDRETDLDVIESGAVASFRGRSSQDVNIEPQSQRQARPRTRKLVEENPFFEGSGSVDGASIPSMDIANADWRSVSQERPISTHTGPNHSQTSLESDIAHWAPGLPIVSNSTSSLRHVTHYPDLRYSQHRAAVAGESLSSSLPTSHIGSTLKPPSWRPSSSGPDGYSSQPMSRTPYSNPELVVPSTHHSSTLSTATSHSPPIQIRGPPSTAATEPSPRLSGVDNVPISRQASQLRHAGPWSPERGSRWDFAPRQASEAVEMQRSGSGGIQFNGRIVEFGRSSSGSRPTSTSPRMPAYPQKITETNEIVTPVRRPVGLGIVVADPERRQQS
ncbi:uncharacterized protein NECHADRAFT_78939 [Fusarium vanettenii 77-13-4]|uniref:NB-ARC domain-containing protein n=1 Tax=Fusarium vanettenii (strain ATCC MYA-4622 / CBS 123669 / FGSC 9596 / NRRL 45880 / 77-13-4) TaxID=660122 RepID=C7YQ07_FUSV7|nr:uncharacterized protein NECHADRAFT_78939 [Fusarium vanettenii 77-13-4]EEU46384.1 hypothetical protein NECHADRAFT_78939 [Fusarium vanettenii 77-13-4]